MEPSKNKESYYKCEECGLIEEEYWLENHVCKKITNPNFRAMQDLNLRIGKRGFVKIKVNDSL